MINHTREQLSCSKFTAVMDAGNGWSALIGTLNAGIVYLRNGLCSSLVSFMRQPRLATELRAWLQFSQGLPGHEADDVVAALKAEKILTTPEDDSQVPSMIRRVAGQRRFKLRVMYLLLSDTCNLACTYCTVRHNTNIRGSVHGLMQPDVIDSALRLAKEIREPMTPLQITFFGGEPLLNRFGFLYALRRIREWFEPEGVHLSLVTNGTLLDTELSRAVAEHTVFPIVSVDGPPNIHNQARVTKVSSGSYANTLRGVQMLQQRGVAVGASILVAQHNALVLPRVVEHLVCDVGVLNLGFSLPHVEPAGLEPPTPDLIAALLAGWVKARSLGTYVVQVGTRLCAFVERRLRLNGCIGSDSGWGMLRVLPNGTLTTCENMGLRGLSILGHVQESAIASRLFVHPELQQWVQRGQHRFKSCLGCIGFVACGAGCTYDAFLETGDMMQPEIRNCCFTQDLIRWAVRDLAQHSLSPVKTPYCYPGPQMRAQILGTTLERLQSHPFFAL
ncbi:MAG: Anaerobic sulfatase-maturating enzyme [Syntrophomonadaceae bacterium]|nr:Anaerobic sulfatase-maturating enzyme [Bacillota bacterium]MBT9147166.1 Anaerobic sulfatase-maturating enzyme [Bacillota bacterium]